MEVRINDVIINVDKKLGEDEVLMIKALAYFISFYLRISKSLQLIFACKIHGVIVSMRHEIKAEINK